MKFQLQFAGSGSGRSVLVQRRRLRMLLLFVLLLVAGTAYWQYLHHLSHGRVAILPHAAVALPGVAAPKMPAAEPTNIPPALKMAADKGLTALWTHMAESFTPVPAPSPAPAAVPAAPAGTLEVQRANPGAVPKPKLHRPPPTAEQRLLHAAQLAMSAILDQAAKYPDSYGFDFGDALEDARLGSPVPIHVIAEQDRAGYRTGQPVQPLLRPASQWAVPVLMGDRVCCMVQVRYNGRDYVPAGGSKSLGMAWSKILEQWPASEGYHPQLVINPEIPGCFFTIPELPVPNLTDTDHLLGLRPGELSPADVILASWR